MLNFEFSSLYLHSIRILEYSNIKPSNSETYSLESIQRAFYKKIRKQSHVQCYNDEVR